ncbi:MAG: lysophospholipid acyltransferase family protein, partial [Burkholderiales bacterium]
MLIFLRSALYIAILIAYTPFFWVLVMLCGVLPRQSRWRVISWWPNLATWLAKHLLRITYSVEGRENIPREPCVILSKHSSAWETIAFSGIFPPHVYVIKREMLWLPFLGWGLALYSPIPINRANRKQAMQRVAEIGAERFKQGFSVMLYPEGTRIPVGKRGTYRMGGAILATKLSAKILPVAHNAGVVWPRNSFLKYPGHV